MGCIFVGSLKEGAIPKALGIVGAVVGRIHGPRENCLVRCFGSIVDEERDKRRALMACGIRSWNGEVRIGWG